MSRDLNKVMLIGRLGADPDLRYTSDGTAKAQFRMACSRRWQGADGQQREETDWFTVIAWRQLAEIINNNLVKGRRVY
ncbi:MAG: single-stranded DNA-binding protein, partial [Chloroflexota bacterium]|nr:single-stranded DNA-binding protein [Chloroflexota bacterium]